MDSCRCWSKTKDVQEATTRKEGTFTSHDLLQHRGKPKVTENMEKESSCQVETFGVSFKYCWARTAQKVTEFSGHNISSSSWHYSDAAVCKGGRVSHPGWSVTFIAVFVEFVRKAVWHAPLRLFLLPVGQHCVHYYWLRSIFSWLSLLLYFPY